MAFSGLHAALCFPGVATGEVTNEQPVMGKAILSHTMASPGKANFKANSSMGQPSFRVTASADSYVAIGKSPNATTGPRHLARALVEYDWGCEDGDELDWILA